MRRSLSALEWQRIYELQGSWNQEEQYIVSEGVLNMRANILTQQYVVCFKTSILLQSLLYTLYSLYTVLLSYLSYQKHNAYEQATQSLPH